MNIIDILGHFTSIAHAASAPAAEGTAGVIGTLGISWKLFLAQLLNFTIILFVLWRFMFKPISQKLTERTAKIDKALKDAEDIEQERLNFSEWKEKEIANAKEEAFEITQSAKREAERIRAEILEKTKNEQAEVVKLAKEEIHQEAENSVKEIKQEIAGLVIGATEKVLQEKLDPAKDKQIIKDAITKTLKS